MIFDNITASRHFEADNGKRTVSFFVERDEKCGANILVETNDNGVVAEFKITHLSLSALKNLAVMFQAASSEKFLDDIKYIESKETMKCPLLTKIEK